LSTVAVAGIPRCAADDFKPVLPGRIQALL
jgi:hypothetical protein